MPRRNWTVPKEWNIRSASITGPIGQTVMDFADSNLHIGSGKVYLLVSKLLCCPLSNPKPVSRNHLPFVE